MLAVRSQFGDTNEGCPERAAELLARRSHRIAGGVGVAQPLLKAEKIRVPAFPMPQQLGAAPVLVDVGADREPTD